MNQASRWKHFLSWWESNKCRGLDGTLLYVMIEAKIEELKRGEKLFGGLSSSSINEVGGEREEMTMKPGKCEHIDWNAASKLEVTYKRGGVAVHEPNFLFCPLCGAPKPVEKELWEKLRDAGISSQGFIGQDYWKAMAEISRTHFEGEKR